MYHNMVQASEAVCCQACGRPIARPKHGFAILANTIEVDGRSIRLSLKMCELLRILARVPGETMHREVIHHALYGDREVDLKVLDVMISHMRRKLAGSPLSIATEYGIGYRLNVEI